MASDSINQSPTQDLVQGVEYRVIGVNRESGREVIFGGCPLTFERAKGVKASRLMCDYANVETARIQARSVIREGGELVQWTEWEDVADA